MIHSILARACSQEKAWDVGWPNISHKDSKHKTPTSVPLQSVPIVIAPPPFPSSSSRLAKARVTASCSASARHASNFCTSATT
eukprot:15269293-Alexandrium_andersonii.AAC.1